MIDFKCIVLFSKFAEKQTNKLPQHINEKLRVWIKSVSTKGISEVRKIKGYHDEPLKGARTGQRSARLNKAYRVIYEEQLSGEFLIIAIIEVNKHEY